MDFMTLLSQNWSVIALLLVGVAYWLLKYVAYSKAKQVALKYLAVAHRIVVGSANVEVLELSKTAYAALPPALKPLVPATLFSAFCIEAYEEVVRLIGEAEKKAEQAPQKEEQPQQEKKEETAANNTPAQ